ncbi:MAG TPA: SRPBCC domain-containing protein [Candidatus Bathyarchaeia archaeon]|nr:SRPBCC domain-containing protein [Candidatus Bathyarchaeia archaeon]
MEQKKVGQTKSVGFQVGVRRTYPIPQEKAWDLVASEEGLQFWLGEGSGISLQPGQKYRTKTGTGEIRIVKPNHQLRLTWQKEEWQRPSTVQIRIISKENNKTTISFHQENLTDQYVREQMKEYWEKVLEGIGERVQNLFAN